MKDAMEFTSHDFYCCACLLASGMRLKRINRGVGKFVDFVFDDRLNQAQIIIDNHWNRVLQIPTRTLIEAIHELKTRLHSGI